MEKQAGSRILNVFFSKSFPQELKLTPRHEVPIVWMGHARNWVEQENVCNCPPYHPNFAHSGRLFTPFFLPCYEIRPSSQQSHMRNKTSLFAPGDWRYYKKFTRFLFRSREEIIIFFFAGAPDCKHVGNFYQENLVE